MDSAPTPRWEGHCRTTQMSLAAATLAVRDAGLFEGGGIDPTRFGVYLGSGEGQEDFRRFVDLVHRSTDGGEVDTRRFTGLGLGLLDPLLEAEQEPGTPAGHLAAVFGARGRTSVPHGLLGQRPGDRRGDRGDPQR